MARALILAAGLLALAATAGAAQAVGVSAVIVEAVEAAPVELEVQLGAAGYEVKVKRTDVRRSLLLERTVVGEAAESGLVPQDVRSGGGGSRETTVRETGIEGSTDRLLVTRVIAANA